MLRLHSDWLSDAVKNTSCGENLHEDYDIDEIAADLLLDYEEDEEF